jgi:diguanylate cyclase (GGDEF)-like protein
LDAYRQFDQEAADGARTAIVVAAGAVTILGFAFQLRGLSFTEEPSLSASINIIGVFLSFTFAANALVRFRGTRDHMALMLAIGFSISALIELGVTLDLFVHLGSATTWFQRVGISFMQGRMLLAESLVLAVAYGRRLPHTRLSARRTALGLTAASTAGYILSASYFVLTGYPRIQAGSPVPRPWDLLPAGLFLLAAVGFQNRLRDNSSAFDHALAGAAWINFGSHLLMMESAHVLDAPSALAQTLRVSSYALVLGGTLLDNSRIFAQVQHLAISDPLTGLANYRHLVDVLESELERSVRTGREFAIILLDLDRLKHINDQYGHLVGNRAICRLAATLGVGFRSIDTPARYGGDEFAVVLPETGRQAALGVAERIRRSLAGQSESPTLSVSTGIAVYPTDGQTAEGLLASADEALYDMKGIDGIDDRLTASQ